jgi:hypothetical protein
LVSDIPAGDGNIEKLFLRCSENGVDVRTLEWERGKDGNIGWD